MRECEWNTPVIHTCSSDVVPADERTKRPFSSPRLRKRQFSLDSIPEECDTDLAHQLHPREVTETCSSSPVENCEQAGPYFVTVRYMFPDRYDPVRCLSIRRCFQMSDAEQRSNRSPDAISAGRNTGHILLVLVKPILEALFSKS